MSTPSGPVLTGLRGVGPAVADRLERLGIGRPTDLLFLLPQRYEDRTRVTPIGGLRAGLRCLVEGEIALANVTYQRRRSLLVRLTDGTGQLTLRFFHFSRAQQAQLMPGAHLRCYGEVRPGPLGPEIVHPEYRVLGAGRAQPLDTRLTPVYPAVEGLGQPRLRDLVHQVLNRLPSLAHELLPAHELRQAGLPSLADALAYVHAPPPGAALDQLAAGLHPSQRRLALEEMLAHHLSLRQLRERARRDRAIPLPSRAPRAAECKQRLLAGLGFSLTAGQQAALADIEADLARPTPMMRLVQGDVGCGKTVLTAIAAAITVAHGRQVAVLAPTELLSEQHHGNFRRWLEPLGMTVAWLTGGLRRVARDALRGALADGSAQVVVGTHALFQEGLHYRSLALVIVDEQHRFGVHQRLRLMEKGDRGQAGDARPHQLVLTATPIPRTLAMTLYADLDTSVIRELPPGRQPVTTVAVPEQRRDEIVGRVREACRTGARAYWVCPLIEESDHLPSQSAEAIAALLTDALPEIRVGLVHGRMRGEEKERVMRAFSGGELQVLVATTVIEVGVDVPSATLMVIENAERLGLAQLHQLRGRVGRGGDTSTCVLMYRSPLTGLARQRLDVLRKTTDGFVVAQRDLELRGPGELLGTRQTGLMQLRVADLVRDADLMPLVHRLAGTVGRDPAALAELVQRWIGPVSRFADV